jgi:hypothetical protein
MSAKHVCYVCGRTVNGRLAIETVDYDLWGDLVPVWVCSDCYGAGAPVIQPAQPPLGFPDQPAAQDAA